MGVSSHVQVDNTDIGCSDCYLVWIELVKATRRGKRVIRKWRLERFAGAEVKLKYT